MRGRLAWWIGGVIADLVGPPLARHLVKNGDVLLPRELAQRAAHQLIILAKDVSRDVYHGPLFWTTVDADEMQRTAELIFQALDGQVDAAFGTSPEPRQRELNPAHDV